MSTNELPYRANVTKQIGETRTAIQSAIVHMEAQKERDSRKISKLYRSLQYLLKAEDAVMVGYPTRQQKPIQQTHQEGANATV